MSLTHARVLRARRQNTCVVCGPDNPNGLHIQFETAEDGRVQARWTPSPAWEGFESVIHGGILATLLDEAMSKAVASSGSAALTAELRVRYRHHVAPGDTLVIRGWIVERTRRLIRTEAVLTTEDGDVRVQGWATFLTVPKG